MPKKPTRKATPHVDVEVPPTEEGGSRSRSFWSGTLSFGLVTVPVDLYSANRTVRRSMRMLAGDGTPLARRYFRAGAEGQLDSEELERGYELEDGNFVTVSDEELESLAPEQSRDIDLTRFVPQDSIPPIYFERSYFMAPSGSTLAYRLLAETMERTKKAGIATFVMRGKQYVVAILAEDGILRAETMRFQDELRSPSDVGLPAPSNVGVDKPAIKRVRSEIKELTKPTLATKELQDEYWQRLTELVERKRKSQQDVVTPEVEAEAEAQEASNVIDLVAVLKRSLGAKAAAEDAVKDKKPAGKETAAKETAAKKRASKTKRPGPRRAADRPSKRAAG